MNMGTPMPEEKKSTSAVVSIIVIVFVIALGAYYFLKQVPLTPESGANAPSGLPVDSAVSALSEQGTSTDIVDIQKDLNSTNLNNLDSGLSNVTI